MSIIKRVCLLAAIWIFSIQATDAQDRLYNVSDHVSKSGRNALITHELQALVDKCHESGGGTIYFPPGDYLTGTLFLKSGVYLELSSGATLYGSKEIGDYPYNGLKSLIYANGQNNLGIEGQGTVNGQGDSFWRGKERHPMPMA